MEWLTWLWRQSAPPPTDRHLAHLKLVNLLKLKQKLSFLVCFQYCCQFSSLIFSLSFWNESWIDLMVAPEDGSSLSYHAPLQVCRPTFSLSLSPLLQWQNNNYRDILDSQVSLESFISLGLQVSRNSTWETVLEEQYSRNSTEETVLEKEY